MSEKYFVVSNSEKEVLEDEVDLSVDVTEGKDSEETPNSSEE